MVLFQHPAGAGVFLLGNGMVIGSAISVFGKGKIHAAFQALGKKKSGVLGLIPASLLGIASRCVCTVRSLSRRLSHRKECEMICWQPL